MTALFAVARQQKSGAYLKQLKDQNEQLRHIRKELAYDLSRLRERHNDLLKESNASHMEKQRLKRAKQEVEQQHSALKTELQVAEEDHAFASGRLKQIHKDLADTTKRNSHLLEQLQGHRFESIGTNKKLAQVSKLIETERSALATLESRLSRIQQERRVAQARLKQQSSVFDDLKLKSEHVLAAAGREENELKQIECQVAAIEAATVSAAFHIQAAEQRRIALSQSKVQLKYLEAQAAVGGNLPNHEEPPPKPLPPSDSNSPECAPIVNQKSLESAATTNPSSSRQVKRPRNAGYRSPRLVRRMTPARAAGLDARVVLQQRSQTAGATKATPSPDPTARSLDFNAGEAFAVPDVQSHGQADLDDLFNAQSHSRKRSTQVPAGGSASNSKVVSGAATPLNRSDSGSSSSHSLLFVPDLPASTSSDSPELQLRHGAVGETRVATGLGGRGTGGIPALKQQPPQELKHLHAHTTPVKGGGGMSSGQENKPPAAAGAQIVSSPQESEDAAAGDLLFF